MKKVKIIFITSIVMISLLLCGCTEDLLTTSDYKAYSKFVKNHDGGLEKHDIFDRFGYPDSFENADGERQNITYLNREEFKDELLDEYSSLWMYEFWKYRDPADPQRLFITFDSEGKSTAAEIRQVGGG